MNTRFRLLLITLGALLVGAIFTFPLWRPLFVDEVVDEAFPGLPADMQEAFRALPQAQQEALLKMLAENEQMARETARAVLGGDQQVIEAMPEMTTPVIVASGSFIQIDALHGASGTATIYRLPDDSLVLRLENFRSTNGPDLRVVLSRHNDPRSRADLGDDYRELGRLKGNVGNQNYAIPGDVDMGQYRSVVIYCDPFQVVFSTATLS